MCRSDYSPRVLAVIPARQGSRRLPGKNNLVLGGESLLCHTLRHVRESELIDAVVVVTDDPVFAATAEQLEVTVVDEPHDLAAPGVPVEIVIEYAINAWEMTHAEPEIIAICEPNVPLRPRGILDRAVRKLQEADAAVDGCLTFEPATLHHPFWAAEIEGDRVHFSSIRETFSESLPPRYHLSSAAFVYRRRQIRRAAGGYAGMNLVGVIHDPGECIHIDTQAELRFAEYVLNSSRDRLESEEARPYPH